MYLFYKEQYNILGITFLRSVIDAEKMHKEILNSIISFLNRKNYTY